MLSARPAVRVNQVGYPGWATKQATLAADGADPVAFSVVTAGGAPVFHGSSRPWPRRPDPSSGLAVHVLDLTPVGPGDGLRVLVGGRASHPFRVGPHVYAGLADDALGLLHLLRSGCEIRTPGFARPAGHPGDVAVPAWRGPDAERLYPGWRETGTFDVSGGWYDAGDYGKYVTSGAIALWHLLHAAEVRQRAGDRWDRLLAECRWQLDWLLRMQVPPGRQHAGMAFHRVHGTEWSPIPGAAHEDPTRRVLHRPSTVATLHLAATAAHGARLFAPLDPAYATRLLDAARTAHAAAHAEPVLVPPDDEGRFGGGPYGDDDDTDDRYWAAVELWLTTGDERYRAELTGSDLHTADVFDPAGFDYDRVGAPARIDLALAGHEDAGADLAAAADRLRALQAAQPWGQPYAPPDGWDWGSNGRILANLVVLAAAHEVTGSTRFRDAVALGADYLFGRNALGQSYVTGYGAEPPRHLRTRQFGSGALPAGAVAGGANSREYPGFPGDPRLRGRPPQCCYLDEATSETTNDICIRWNAPLVRVADVLG